MPSRLAALANHPIDSEAIKAMGSTVVMAEFLGFAPAPVGAAFLAAALITCGGVLVNTPSVMARHKSSFKYKMSLRELGGFIVKNPIHAIMPIVLGSAMGAAIYSFNVNRDALFIPQPGFDTSPFVKAVGAMSVNACEANEAAYGFVTVPVNLCKPAAPAP